MWLRLVFMSVIVSYCTGTPIPADTCGSGQYKHRSGDPVCLECTEGENFMPENGHQNSQCYNCSEIKDAKLELVYSTCNKTHDTVIVCISGYYWNTENKKCVGCKSCSYTGRPCQSFSDSVCCPGDNYEVIDDICKLFCREGEYLSVAADKCLPCEEDHYNSNQAHRDTNCRKCHVPDKLLHLIIEVPCNKTHDTVLVCERNYFFWNKPFSDDRSGKCEKCVNCSVENQYEGKPCSRESNTVCCPEPGMIVKDSDGCVEDVTTVTTATATPGPKTCGKGQYLNISFNYMNTSCVPCRHGTYQDLVNHTEAQCKNCTQFNGTESQLPETCQVQEERPHKHNNSHLSGGVIAAIVVSVVVVLVLLVIVIYVCVKLRQRQPNRENQAGREIVIDCQPLTRQRPTRPTKLQNELHRKQEEQQAEQQQQTDMQTDSTEGNILETQTVEHVTTMNNAKKREKQENLPTKSTPKKMERQSENVDKTINNETFDDNIGRGLKFMDDSDTDTKEDDPLVSRL